MEKTREVDLSKPVAEWLRQFGYTVYSEVPFYGRCIDMVGIDEEKIRVVELKVRFAAKGIWQAVKCRLATSDIYLAVGKRPMDKTLEKYKQYGVGILLVDGEVKVLRKPNIITKPWEVAAKHLRENCSAIGPSDIAGMPCMSGCGPAQAVLAFVKGYIEEHPEAGWKELHANVPNHYSSHKSMASAMSGYMHMPLYKIKEARQGQMAMFS